MHADHAQSSWRRIIINDILFANVLETRFDAIAAKTGQMTLTPRGMNSGNADGSVHHLSYDIDRDLFDSLADRRDGVER